MQSLSFTNSNLMKTIDEIVPVNKVRLFFVGFFRMRIDVLGRRHARVFLENSVECRFRVKSCFVQDFQYVHVIGLVHKNPLAFLYPVFVHEVIKILIQATVQNL